MIQRLVFNQTGVPEDVLRLEEGPELTLQNNELKLELLYAPINPSDINFLQGVYGIKANLPSTAGFEGVARVIESPPKSEIKNGTLVLPLKSFYTWQTQVTCKPEECIPLPAGLEAAQASMLSINPMTALRLLRDFANLSKGDLILQNAANSAVGIAIIQLASHFGYRTLNLVRREENREQLEKAGADRRTLSGGNIRRARRCRER